MKSSQTRRSFLRQIAMTGGALAAAANLPAMAFGQATAPTAMTSNNPWAKQIGLELFTVRDLLSTPKSYVATLEKLAAIGYKEIEPANGYAGMTPKEFRATLDRLGLSMPSTHSGATEGPDLEKELEGFQVMGLKYIEISAPRPAGGRGPGGPRPAATPGRRPQMNFQLRTESSEAVKQTAEKLNEHGKVAKKFGMKILVHNHTTEFAPLSDKPDMKPYDILLAHTDPDLVAMQLDIGWAIQAGQDPLAMFKKSPGRFELWHVKDMSDIDLLPAGADEGKRMQLGARSIVPLGLGDIDYKPIFEAASLSGMKHFCVEQDTAADWGDSVAASGVSYKNLIAMLG